MAAAIEPAVSLPTVAKDSLTKVTQDAQWGMLNERGQRDARTKAMEKPFTRLVRAKLEARRLREGLSNAMPRLPELAKDDVVGFLRDQEARAHVRSLPADQRSRVEHLAPELTAAVVRAVPELSGVSPSVHHMMRDQLTEQLAPGRLGRGAWALMISFGHGFATAPMSGKVAGYVALRPPAWFLAVEGPQAAYGAEVWVGLAS